MDDRGTRTLTRRTFIKGAAAAAAVPVLAACVGDVRPPDGTATTAPAIATRTTGASTKPANLSGTLRVLQWSHPIADYDAYLDAWATAWGTRNGLTVRIDRIPQADLPARIAAEAAAKSGHDILGLWSQTAAVFDDSLVDISDICDAAASRYGGFLPAGEAVGKVGGRWKAYPNFFIPLLSLWRKDAWEKLGYPKGPQTWQDVLDAAPRLQAGGTPIGTAYSRTADAEQTWRSLLWSYGAGEFTADGKGVAIDSPETRQALELAKALRRFQEPAVLSWSDLDNGDCLRSGRCSWVSDPIATYRTIETQDPGLAKDVLVDLPVGGPKGRACAIQWESYAISSFSKNVEAARAFLIDYIPEFAGQAAASKGYNYPLLKSRLAKPMPVLGGDPKLQALQDVAPYIRTIGYPGPSTRAAFDALNAHVVTDMFASYATGSKSLDDSVAEAKRRLLDSIARFPS